MSQGGRHEALIIPALRAQLGDWIYYISYMKLKDLVEWVNRTPLFYGSPQLQELLQRQLLENRGQDIADYLVKQKQHFFNALVIGTSGGDPKWHEIVVKEKPATSEEPLPEHVEKSMGLLELSGSEKLSTIDGQHRVEGIRTRLCQVDGSTVLTFGLLTSPTLSLK